MQTNQRTVHGGKVRKWQKIIGYLVIHSIISRFRFVNNSLGSGTKMPVGSGDGLDSIFCCQLDVGLRFVKAIIDLYRKLLLFHFLLSICRYYFLD